MLFNSYAFIFIYLPITFFGFFWLARHSHRAAAGWLAIASLAFYAYWNVTFVGLLLGSVVFNYALGWMIGHSLNDRVAATPKSKALLVLAIASNLALLGYYKYANFFIDSANQFFGAQLPFAHIVLPLGISFFTFTQIAFLVDTYRGIVKEYNFVHYLLFVTYFPHLIAGPVLHHKQMMPQFAESTSYRLHVENIAVGLTIFSIGLFKKVMLADNIAGYANPFFSAAHEGVPLGFFESWAGALAYTLQLYFDFSGYSDMAIGLSRMFNVKLPLNFNSPYKAWNIIEFWRRWHMTLSQFLRDYLYFPLGGNRRGPIRRYANLLITMLLGGLWHGAGWTFVIWGGLHGLYLMMNHAWLGARKRWGLDASKPTRTGRVAGVALTFGAVMVGWVFFRADSFSAALSMLRGMAGFHGVSLPRGAQGVLAPATSHFNLTFDGLFPHAPDLSPDKFLILAPLYLAIVWLMPNTQQFMRHFSPAWGKPIEAAAFAFNFVWQPRRRYALLTIAMLTLSLVNFTRVSQFLYFQF